MVKVLTNKKTLILLHIIGVSFVIADVFIIFKICQTVINGNDKAVLFFIFYYPILMILNFIIGAIMNRWMETTGRYLVVSAMAMLIIGFPLFLWVISQ